MAKDIPLIPLLGYTEKEKTATLTALETLKNEGYKFAVLMYDDSFLLYLYNLTKNEEKAVIERLKNEYKAIESVGGDD